MGSYDDLIARIEAASKGSRELEGEIAIATGNAGPNSEGACNIRLDPDDDGWLLFEIGAEECCNAIPAFTTSLDAAMTLVPEGWRLWSLDASVIGRFCIAMQGPKERIEDPESDGVFLNIPSHCDGKAKTLALAICAAALKARAATGAA